MAVGEIVQSDKTSWDAVPDNMKLEGGTNWRDLPDKPSEEVKGKYGKKCDDLLDWRATITSTKKAVDKEIGKLQKCPAEKKKDSVEKITTLMEELAGKEDASLVGNVTIKSIISEAVKVLKDSHQEEDLVISMNQKFNQPTFAILKTLLDMIKKEKQAHSK